MGFFCWVFFSYPRPSCLQITLASLSDQWESHTAPHWPFRYTSTRPLPEAELPTRRAAPEERKKGQKETRWFTNQQAAYDNISTSSTTLS